MPHPAVALLQGPDRVLAWADQHARLLQRSFVGVAVAAVLLWHTHAIAGTAGLAVFGTALATAGLAGLGYRRAPQVTGTAVSTLAFTGLVMIAATALDPLWMIVGVDELALAYPAVFIVVALCAWLQPSKGVHRGWTTVIGQGAMIATMPLAVWSTGTSWRGITVLTGAVVALLLVGLRIRKVAREDRRQGWRRAARAGAMSVAVAILGMSVVVASSGEARAFTLNPMEWAGSKFGDALCAVTAPNLSPEPVGTGPENLFSNINFGGAHQPGATEQPPQYANVATDFTRAGQAENHSLSSYTLYETAGLRGLKWVNWQKTPDGDESCGFGPWTSVMVGNLLFKVTIYGLQTTLAFKEWSQAENPLEVLYTKANPIVDEVFTKFFMPMGAIMFMVAGLAIGARAVRSAGMREGIGDAAGSLLVLALAGFAYGGIATASFANPNGNGFYMTAKFMDTMAAGFNNAFADMVFSTIEGDQTSMCQRPTDGGGNTSPVGSGQRLTSCILAESLAYTPWAVGQFGVAGADPIPTSVQPHRFSDPTVDAEPAMDQGSGGPAEAGLPCYNNVPDHNGIGCGDLRSYLIAQEGGPSISARVSECINEGADADTGDEVDYEVMARCEPYHAVAADLYEQAESGGGMPPSMAADIVGAYQGQGSFPHVAQAFASIIGAVVTGVGLGSMGVITLLWHAWLWVLFLMGLFQLLWGAYPGKRDVAKDWATGVLSTFVQRLLYGFAMTLMIWVIAVVFAMQVHMGIKIVWTILVLIGTWMLIQKIQNAASDKSPNMARYGKIAGAAPAVATGYVGGKAGAAGGRYVGRKSAAAGAATARGGARLATAGAVGTGRAAGRGGAAAGRWAGGHVNETVAKPVTDSMTAKTQAARSRINSGTASHADKARVKTADGIGATQDGSKWLGYQTRRAGHGVAGATAKVRDTASMSTADQMRGVRGAHSSAHAASQPLRDAQKKSEQERREGRKQAREEIQKMRAERAKERSDFKRSMSDTKTFGLGKPVNRPDGRGER